MLSFVLNMSFQEVRHFYVHVVSFLVVFDEVCGEISVIRADYFNEKT